MARKKSGRKRIKQKKTRQKNIKRGLYTLTFFVAIILLFSIAYLDLTQYRETGNSFFGELYRTLFTSRDKKLVRPGQDDFSKGRKITEPLLRESPVFAHPTRPPDPTVVLEGASGLVAIIIDDMGYNGNIEKRLLDLGWPLSYAVIPHLEHSRDSAEMIERYGCEVLLHLPMEPVGYPDTSPGEQALLLSLSFTENRSRLLKALKSVPFAIGINNHMGSRFTQDRNHMINLLREIRSHNLFFIDSRTTAQSVAYDCAKTLGVPAAKRDIFLDHKDDYDSIRDELYELANLAQEQGSAIGIGHPRLNTWKALRDFLPGMVRSGIKIVPISELVTI